MVTSCFRICRGYCLSNTPYKPLKTPLRSASRMTGSGTRSWAEDNSLRRAHSSLLLIAFRSNTSSAFTTHSAVILRGSATGRGGKRREIDSWSLKIPSPLLSSLRRQGPSLVSRTSQNTRILNPSHLDQNALFPYHSPINSYMWDSTDKTGEVRTTYYGTRQKVQRSKKVD